MGSTHPVSFPGRPTHRASLSAHLLPLLARPRSSAARYCPTMRTRRVGAMPLSAVAEPPTLSPAAPGPPSLFPAPVRFFFVCARCAFPTLLIAGDAATTPEPRAAAVFGAFLTAAVPPPHIETCQSVFISRFGAALTSLVLPHSSRS
jgi:hypothetical protein